MNDSTEHQELLLLYEVTVNDLAYFKSQQWAVANYSFVLMAALAGARQLIGDEISSFEKLILVTLVLLVSIVGFVVIDKLQKSVEVRDARLDETRKRFSGAFKLAWSAKEKKDSKVKVIYFLNSALIIGAILVSWVIYR